MLKTQGIERSLGIKCSKEGRALAAAGMTCPYRDALRGPGSSEGTEEPWVHWEAPGAQPVIT